MAPKQCGIHSKPLPLLQKTCLSYAYETLATYDGTCLRIHALDALPVDAGRDPCMQVVTHVCRPRATLIILFPKKVIFSILILLKSISYLLGL